MQSRKENKDKTNASQTSTASESLISDLREYFPIGKQQFYKGLFAFSNDCDYPLILSTLTQSKTKVSDEKTKVALLVGQSNFSSMLPELLQYGVDLVLLVDIDFRVHEHNLHILNCKEQSDTPEDFIKNYLINNPIDGYILPGTSGTEPRLLSPSNFYCKDTFLILLKDTVHARELGKYHFLFNLERYLLCKSTAKQMAIERLTLDLMNEEACLKFAHSLQRNNAELVFCNFTNIHEYDKKNTLSSSLVALTHASNQCYVMFSERQESNMCPAELSMNMNKYFEYCLKEDYAKCKERLLKKEVPQTVNFSNFTEEDKSFYNVLAKGNMLMFKAIEKEKNKSSENGQDKKFEPTRCFTPD